VIDDETAGGRLDVVLAVVPEVGSRSQAATLIAAGAVTIGGLVPAKSYRPHAGDVIQIELPPEVRTELVAEDVDLSIPFEDEWLLVVDKPAGMVAHPARGHSEGTLVHALLGHGIAGGDSFRPGIVHRLDKDTSGLLLVAKDREVHRRLTQMIRSREVERRYLALVHGNVTAPSGTINAPIGRDRQRRKTMAIEGAGAREAITTFAVRERLGEFTLLDVRLETGRTHQIRVHFLAIGHPVVGDPTYARRDLLGVGRQFLHSYRVNFVHPVTGVEVTVESPLPPDLAVVLERVREADQRGGGVPRR
jgi:23S rRNA pseudouridine1911/1915/1917 synthase